MFNLNVNCVENQKSLVCIKKRNYIYKNIHNDMSMNIILFAANIAKL